MDLSNMLFNALIVGLTNSGKTWFLLYQLCGPFCGKFDYIELICWIFTHNKTLKQFAETDLWFFVVICEQHKVEFWLKVISMFFRRHQHSRSPWWLCSLKRCEKVDQGTGQVQVFRLPWRHHCVGAYPAAFQHRKVFLRKCGRAVGEDHKGYF